MNCEYFETLISDLIDGELSPDQSKELLLHLDDCQQCRELRHSFYEINKLYSQLKAPTAQKEKIIASIKGEQRSSKGGFHMFANNLITKNLSIAALLLLSFMTIYVAAALKDSPVRPVFKKPAPGLPAVGSYKNFKKILLANARVDRHYVSDERRGRTLSDDTSNMLSESSAMSFLKSSPAADGNYFPHSSVKNTSNESFSKTNIQVQGVDEADIVKTDGQYIYQVNAQEIKIIEAYPAKDMKVAQTIKLIDKEIAPREVYLDDKYLTIIGSTYMTSDQPAVQGTIEPDVKGAEQGRYSSESLVHPGDTSQIVQESVKVRVYDISDKSDIKKVRDLEVGGYLISSRKIGSALYLVANKNLDTYTILENKDKKPSDIQILPAYKDSKGSNKYETQGYNDIRYLPGSQSSNYLIVAGFSLNKMDEEAKISSYLGAGENIYASTENLYVAVREMDEKPKTKPAKNPDQATDNKTDDRKFIKMAPAEPIRENTAVYKFALDNGEATYTGKGKVPGTILNQFSMDAFAGNFRIATTKGDMWAEGNNTSKNNMYVLDDSMKTVGKLEGLAPGERIYSARFMGDRAYMVTFRQTDPLYVIDLKDSKAPKVLGELKIPGFSNYLHPYDANHIIGFGKDANEETGMTGGMKIAMFDVSNVNKPVEKFKTIIGGSGTESPLLHDHKALLFDKDRNLMAFPINIWQNSGVRNNFEFAGAYVYDVSLDTGLQLKGKITHQRAVQKKSTNPREIDRLIMDNYQREIQRILYIDQNLYTLSNKQVSAHDIDKLKEIKSVSLGK